MLGSSGWGAQVAGQLGWPFSFAHHFGMGGTVQALELYRDNFRASDWRQTPYAMIGVQVLCAPSFEEARFLAGASALGFLRLRQGRPGPMPTPEEADAATLTFEERAFLDGRLASAVLGTPADVRSQLTDLVERYGVDELMVTTATHRHEDRVRSFELLADIWMPSVPRNESTPTPA